MPRRARLTAALAAAVAALVAVVVLRRAPAPAQSAAPGSPSASSGTPPDAAAPPADRVGSPAIVTGAEVTPEVTTVEDDEAFRLLVFPVRVEGARFRVVDLGMTRDLGRVVRESGASFVVNGGFFDPAHRPEGLVVSEGVTLSPRSDSLGGGVVVIAGARALLAPAEGFAPPPGTDLAIQARPRLVVDGGGVIARDDGRAAERTAICLRDQGSRIEVIVARGEAAGRGPTLALLADMLVSRGCEAALNLDGGPSTGVAWREGGEVRALEPRGPLRHAIAVWLPAGG